MALFPPLHSEPVSDLLIPFSKQLALACAAVACCLADEPGRIEAAEPAAAPPPAKVIEPVGGRFMPTPRKLDETGDGDRFALFYALPVIGFWLILRRRGRGVRL